MSEKYNYSCPGCSAGLSRDGEVMLTMTRSTGEKSNLILHPKPGVYGYYCTPPLKLEDGELVECYCPYCWESLRSESFPNFVSLNLHKLDGSNVKVLFSRLVGQHKTYIVNEAFTNKYGDGSKKLLDLVS